MPDPELTPLESTPESSLEPGAPEGPSEGPSAELPEEFKPYSWLPWDQIPEDTRQEVLQGVKKFHGDMTRSSQEAKKQLEGVTQFREKANMLDQLFNEPWFQEAFYKSQGYSPGGASSSSQNAMPDPTSLSEMGMDTDQIKAINQLVSGEIQKGVKPLADQLSHLRKQVSIFQFNRELEELRAYAKEHGLPPPDDRMNEIEQLIIQGQARDAKSAYRQSVFDEAQKLAEKRGRERYREEIQKKAESSIPPGTSPAQSPRGREFSGRNALADALQAAKEELGFSGR